MSNNYNVVINSSYCTTESVGNATSNKNYYIDWSAILPDKHFKLSFSFISEGATILNLINIPIITIYFLNLSKIISSNNYRIFTSLTADTLIYKNNLHIKKSTDKLQGSLVSKNI